MSDDSTPTPSLRLKPRAQRTDAPAPTPPGPDASSTPAALPPTAAETPTTAAAASTGSEMPSLRLRPRGDGARPSDPSLSLSGAATSPLPPASDLGGLTPPGPVEPLSQTVAPPPPVGMPDLPPPFPGAPADPAPLGLPPPAAPSAPKGAETPVADAIDPNRLKLKPRTAGTEGAAAAAGAPRMAPLPPPISLPPVRTAPPMAPLPPPDLAPPAAMPPPPLPPSVHAGSSALPPTAATPKAARKQREHSPVVTAVVWGSGILAVVLLAGGGFYGFTYLAQKEKERLNPPSATKSKDKPAPKSEPSADAGPSTDTAAAEPVAPVKKGPLARPPQSTAGKLVGKAQEAIAAREASGQVSGVDEVMEDAAPGGATPRPPRAEAPAPAVVTTAPSSTAPAAGVLPEPTARPATPAVETRPNPGAPFRTFVANMRVNGVFQGDPGRAFINGRMYHVGEVVDAPLGIRFTSLDPARKTLYFEDRTGAQMGRRY